MVQKGFYLGLSSQLLFDNSSQIHKKLELLRKNLHNEGIVLISLEREPKVPVEFMCGYIGKRDDNPLNIESIAIPKLDIEDILQPVELENFLTQVFTLIDYHQQVRTSLSKGALIQFHSRYKYLLMAYSPVAYQELGRYMASIPKVNELTTFAFDYLQKLMATLRVVPTREGHTNALMHMAGYFKRVLDASQRQALTQLILHYRQGNVALSEPFELLAHWLAIYPDEYLVNQRYFLPYPLCFKELRTQM